MTIPLDRVRAPRTCADGARTTATRFAGRFLLAACVGLGGCAGAVPSTAPASDQYVAELRARVARSRSDTESGLLLASGLWGRGERDEAYRLLQELRAAVPEEPAFRVAEGVAAEGVGNLEGAYAAYRSFLAGAGGSRLRDLASARMEALRAQTAAFAAREALAHEPLPRAAAARRDVPDDRVVALARVATPDGDPELGSLAAAATEILMLDLRERGERVVDWEVTEAVRRELGAGRNLVSTARRMQAALQAHASVRVDLARGPADSVSFRARVARISASGDVLVTEGVVRMPFTAYPAERARLSARVWEMVLGAVTGSVPDFVYAEGSAPPLESILSLGAALDAAFEGDAASARVALERAESLAPGFAPVMARLSDADLRDEAQRSEVIPGLDVLLRWARLREATAALGVGADGAGTLTPERYGIGELLGLDRVGSQLTLDVVIEVAGGSE